jgi:hypothetical protein
LPFYRPTPGCRVSDNVPKWLVIKRLHGRSAIFGLVYGEIFQHKENFDFGLLYYKAYFYLCTMFQFIISDGIIIRQCLHT